MTTIDTVNFTKSRGNPNSYSAGIRWFQVDGKKVQVYGKSWKQVEEMILKSYPDAKTIELLTK